MSKEKLRGWPTIGVMGIVTFWNKALYACQREKEDKAWCRKSLGDVGFIGGSIKEKELPPEALKRELWEERRLKAGDYLIDPKPYGRFLTDKGWVQVHVVFLRENKVGGRWFGPQDGETDCPSFITSDLLSQVAARGGMEDVILAFERGERGFDFSYCRGGHIGEDGRFAFNTILVVDRKVRVKNHEVIWGGLLYKNL